MQIKVELKDRILFHVGFPKAASTTLQKNLFAGNNEILNLGLFPTSNIGIDTSRSPTELSEIPYIHDKRLKTLYGFLTHSSGIEFEYERAIRLLNEILNDYNKQINNRSKNIIFSNESVTSVRFSSPELIDKAYRIKKVFGAIKIIIIIRNQRDMLKSLYRDHPYDPRMISFKSRYVNFDKWIKIDFERGPLSLIRSLHFNKVVQVYDELFGEENVLVLPMEWLIKDLQSFSGLISQFMMLDTERTLKRLKYFPQNIAISEIGDYYRIIKSKAISSFQLLGINTNKFSGLDKDFLRKLGTLGRKRKINLSNANEKFLHEYYKIGNQKIAENRQISLGSLGYYI